MIAHLHASWFDLSCLFVAVMAVIDAWETRGQLRRARYALSRIDAPLDIIGESPYYGPVVLATTTTTTLFDQDQEP